MKEKRRCSILFHLLVPGGRWLTTMSMPSWLASFCSSRFHSRTRDPLLPPPSAVISNRGGVGGPPPPTGSHPPGGLFTPEGGRGWGAPPPHPPQIGARALN